MRLLTPSKLREILEDPKNSVDGGHSFDLGAITREINTWCSGPTALDARVLFPGMKLPDDEPPLDALVKVRIAR